MFSIEKSAGRNKVKRIVIPWTTSFKLPYDGGVMDQPYRMMTWFTNFIEGDRAAANKRLNSNS